ncbi:MAG: metal-sensing transcriptional repressor [Erysipelotrichaceae bacterium]|nr:metal-sensing transcriptional repressor [Erysipelotrichaceae bacterium]
MKADSQKVMRYLKTVRGQIDGIIKMVEDDRYCIDISHQILASQALLKKTNQEILTAHLRHCVHDSAGEEEKIEEMVKMIEALLK